MKIVQFRNGDFGIRKLTIAGYMFLSADENDDFWWRDKDYVIRYAHIKTREGVIERWKSYKGRPRVDNGNPVKDALT